MKVLGRFALVALALLGTACTRHVPPTGAKPAADFDWMKTWGEVLSENVGDTGTIDFVNVKAHPEKLKNVVAWVGNHGPHSTPELFATREAKLAYYINSYNALAMYNAITSKVKPKDKIRFFLLTKMKIDGKDMDLHAYENKIIRPVGEERVHFELNCMVKGCPRLSNKPVAAEGLEQTLADAATLFLNEDRNLQIQPEKKVVRISSILKFYTPDFLKKAPTLIDYANKVRAPEKQIPKDYKVEFIPYDWALNQKP